MSAGICLANELQHVHKLLEQEAEQADSPKGVCSSVDLDARGMRTFMSDDCDASSGAEPARHI